MNVEQNKRTKTAVLDKILGTVYNTKHMISLHYFDRQIELERAFTRFERLLSLYVKQQLQRSFTDLSRSKTIKSTRSHKAAIFIVKKLSRGRIRAIIMKLRHFASASRKVYLFISNVSMKRFIRDLKIGFLRLRNLKQDFNRLDRLMRKEHIKQQLTALYILLNYNSNVKVEINKNYNISSLNEITRQVRSSFKPENVKPTIISNYVSYQHKTKAQELNHIELIDNISSNTEIIQTNSNIGSPRSFDVNEVLCKRRTTLIDESELLMERPSTELFHKDINHPNLMDESSDYNKNSNGQRNYYDYLNRESMKQSVNASFTSSQKENNEEDDNQRRVMPMIAESNTLLEYKKRKKRLVKPKSIIKDDEEQHTTVKDRYNIGEFRDDKNDKPSKPITRDRSKEKIVSALAAIQEKLDQLTSAQDRKKQNDGGDEKSANRSFIILNKSDLKPKNFEVENSYIGYYIEKTSGPKSEMNNQFKQERDKHRNRMNSVNKQMPSSDSNFISNNPDYSVHSTIDKKLIPNNVLAYTPTRVFSFNKLVHHELKNVKSRLKGNDFSNLQNFAVLLNFFVTRRVKSKYVDIMNVISKVVQRSKNMAKVKSRLDYLFHKKLIKDFKSASLFQSKKIDKGLELAQTLVKNQKRKARFTMKLLMLKRGSGLSTLQGFENISEINRYTSNSKTNKLFSRIHLNSNNFDISGMKDESVDDSFDQLENEYENKVIERQKRTTSYYSNIKNL